MLFQNLIEGLTELPLFFHRYLRDENPVGGPRKRRKIEMPNGAMRIVQTRLSQVLRRVIRHSDVPFAWTTACLPSASPYRNAQRHRGNRFFYVLDLHDAYHCVSFKLLALYLCDMVPGGYTWDALELQRFLEQYCSSTEGGLATGANASPDLFNIYCHRALDLKVQMLCEQHEWTYTRYLDDLTFSSSSKITRSQRRAIRSIILKAGFTISHHKCRLIDIQRRPVTITGIRMDKHDRAFLPRRYLRKIRSILHLALERKVSREVAAGYMGTFWSAKGGKGAWLETQTERKVRDKIRKLLKGH